MSGLRKAKASVGLGDAARDQQLGQHLRQMRRFGRGASDSSGWGSAMIQRWRGYARDAGSAGARLRSTQRYSSSSSCVVGVVDHDVLEAFDIFEQRLVALVPLGGGFVQEHQALVDEAELNVAEHAGVLAQPLRLDQLGGFLIGEVHLAGFFDERFELFAFQRHLAEGDEGSARRAWPSPQSLSRRRGWSCLPKNGRNVFGDIAGQAAHAVALDEGHHVVFQRKQIIRAHVSRHFRRCGRVGCQGCGKLLRQGRCVRSGGRLVWKEEDFTLPLFEHHVFVCHNVRPEGAPRPSCTSDGKSESARQLQQLTKAAGLADRVRINK